ncbi:hypothetical protein MMC13_005924 [Lambiella insularis]|nr:hypothetical protein [Lambiella insularis]
MDAKPQRPVRTLRVHGDENVPLTAQNYKTLHSRNKSSPALYATATLGASKPGNKRAVFGDVSNTAHGNRPARDDSAIEGKVSIAYTEKVVQPIQDQKPSVLSRPVQRPLSVSGLKGLLNNLGNATVNGTVKQDAPPLANPRKVLTKRNTAIFTDPTSQQIEPAVIGIRKPVAVKAPLLPVHRDLKQHSNTSELSQAALRKAQSKQSIMLEPKQDAESLLSLPDTEVKGAAPSNEAFVDDWGNLHVCEYTEETDRVGERLLEQDNGVPLPQEMRKAENAVLLKQIVQTQLDNAQELVQPRTLPAVSEPEEYWEEDEYDENYDEDGYVTARSFKSRGDNTTGGATTILFPKVTNKVKKELAAAKELVESSRTADEIEDEAWDMSMVAEYGDEIFQYMKELEIKMLPNAHYMDNQAEIQWSMRSVLMDWLVQVHQRFGLLPETLFLCVNYIDRFLSCKVVSLGKLQLVGATAIFVAAKYEEINCPSVQEIVYMVDGGYTVDEILKAERFMLSMLQFELGWPGPMSFLRRISKADDYDLETRTLAKYFLEITIMDERFLGSPPSFAAAGAHCLARMMLKKGNWSPAHVYYSNYTYAQLYPLVQMMFECCENPQKHHSAIYDKYTDKRYKRASHYVESEILKGFRLAGTADNNAATFVSFYDHQLFWDQK